MYRYVQLQISLFMDKQSNLVKPTDIKAKILQAKNQDVSKSDLLQLAYDEIYNRDVGEEDVAPTHKKHALKTYSLLLCCFVPFSLNMLVDAVALDEETGIRDPVVDGDYIMHLGRDLFLSHSTPQNSLAWLGELDNFRRMHDKSPSITFAHVSVREYLEQRPEFTPALNHYRMLRVCIRSVIVDQNNILGRHDDRVRAIEAKRNRAPSYRNNFSLAFDVVSNLMPDWILFWGYATQLWPLHMSEIDLALDKSFQRSALDLLANSNFQNWHLAMKTVLAKKSAFDSPFKLLFTFPLMLGPKTSSKDIPEYEYRIKECICDEDDLLFVACAFELPGMIRWHIEKDRSCVLRQNVRGQSLLHVAVRCGSEEVVRILLENNADINSKASSEHIETRIELGHNYHKKGEWITPIVATFNHPNPVIFELLLEKFRTGNWCICDSQDNSLLHFTLALCERGLQWDTVREHRNQFSQHINCRNKIGLTALHVAAYRGSQQIELLLQLGSDINAVVQPKEEMRFKSSDFHFHLYRKYDSDRELEARDMGYTALTALGRAVHGNHMGTVQKLLDLGADVNGGFTGTEEGWMTPLHIAIANASKEIASLLMRYGAQIDIPGVPYTCLTAFQLAIDPNMSPSILQTMVEKGANKMNRVGDRVRSFELCKSEPFKWRRLRGYAPLDIAVSRKLLVSRGKLCERMSQGEMRQQLELLLKHGAQVNAEVPYGRHHGYRPIHIAASNSDTHYSVVYDLLMRHGADFGTPLPCGCDEGLTPLHLASKYAIKEDHLRLIQTRADANLEVAFGPYEGLQPIHLALYDQFPELEIWVRWDRCNMRDEYKKARANILCWILAHGVDPDDRIRRGKYKGLTALELAVKWNHLNLIRVKQILTERQVTASEQDSLYKGQ